MMLLRRNTPPTIATLWLLACVPCVFATAGGVDEFQDFSELNLEDLLNQEVVTASRHAQKISESPVAATVITAEQIAASGATTIPELLRDVPGLDVMVPSATHFDVSARGLNELGSNSILVLVDGRSVYADYYGLTLWDYLPVAIDEIKVIEVIKGPGSAFYGANAFACVINIITLRPEEIDGTLVRTATSSYGDGLGSVVHGGSHDRFGWRLSTSLRQAYDWEADTREGDMVRFNAHADWEASEESLLTLAAGHSDGNILFAPAEQSMVLDGHTSYLSADYTWRDLEVRWFSNKWVLGGLPMDGLITTDEVIVLDAYVHDFELRHKLRPGGDHFLQWGVEFRRKSVDWMLLRQSYAQNIYTAFLYDEWRSSDKLIFSIGLRYDDHPLVGGHLAPRGGIVLRPSERHALRATYGVAYRDPTYLESYMYAEVEGFLGLNPVIRGDPDLNSEKIRSLEVGYQGLLRDNLMVSVAAFRNEVRDFIDMDVVETFSVPPAPVEGIPAEIAFLNDDNWDMSGGELSLETRLTGWLQAKAHWAYVWAEHAGSGECVVRVPRHIAGAALSVALCPRHSVELRARYKSRTTWMLGTLSGTGDSGPGDERFVLDARWHLKLGDGATHAVLGVENVFNKRFRDHPSVIQQQRRASASLRTRF